MLRNYLATALRHLARNRLYSAISIIGLAVGLCGALMAALVIESELRYDTFLPDHEQTYLAVTVGTPRVTRHFTTIRAAAAWHRY